MSGTRFSTASSARKGGVLALLIALLPLAGCGSKEPFGMTPVSGTITYEDGSKIPAARIHLSFYPQTPPRDDRTSPRLGQAEVDVATGQFSVVTSHYYADGLVVGKHKVVVDTQDAREQSIPLVSPEYRDSDKTPLEVDTKDQPFSLKVRKPAAK